MKTEHQSQIIKQMIRKRGKSRREIAQDMDISTMTLTKYITKPMTMRGDNRQRMAQALGIQVEVIDTLINGSLRYDHDTVEAIMEGIQQVTQSITTKTEIPCPKN